MKGLITALIALLCLCRPVEMIAQPYFPPGNEVFGDETVPRIDIFIDPADLNNIYTNIFSNVEYPATFIFNDGVEPDTVFDVGFRLRGNTSRGSAKKSFKVAFNSFIPGKKYKGLEKMNLNGEHNDPSISRSKLCWDQLNRMRIPAPRSNHVQLYINNDYYGLYINVEHIDEEFVKSRFGNNDGNLFKCTWPADLNYISNNPTDYMGLGYELKTNKLANDFSDLAHFIDVLNNTSIGTLACALRQVFNVEDYLKCIAFDVLTANWDGPIYNKNNFYLYHNTETGKFEYIPYDLDNTFGIDWFGVDWANRDMYTWSHPSEYRPVFERLMLVPEFKDLYSYYMDEMVNSYFSPAEFHMRIDAIRNRISPFVPDDTYYTLDYGFDYNDFLDSYEQDIAVSAGIDHVPVGLKPFVSQRAAASSAQVVPSDIKPVVTYLRTNRPQINEDIVFNAFVEDDGDSVEVVLHYQIDGGTYNSMPMFDNGQNDDGFPDDGRYGAMLTGISNPGSVNFHVVATDEAGQETRTPCTSDQTLMIDTSTYQLYINEFMAVNQTTLADNFGEYDDWIEIYNGEDTASIWTGNIYLSDEPDNPDKWQMPDTLLEPGAFLLIWADEDGSQGANHASFKLNQYGESLSMYQELNGNFIPLDIINYGPQLEDVTYGYYPDGMGDHQLMGSPTPGASNLRIFVEIEEFENRTFLNSLTIGPNPFVQHLRLGFTLDRAQHISIRLFNLQGKELAVASNTIYEEGPNHLQWDVPSNLAPGIHLLQIYVQDIATGASNLYSRKVMYVGK